MRRNARRKAGLGDVVVLAVAPPARTPPPTVPPTARPSRRQHFAGALLLAGSLGLIGSYFLPWVYSAPACGFPQYCGTGVTRTGWAQVGIYLNPTTQDWKWTIQTFSRGDATALGMVAFFLFLYAVVPLALVWFGARVWRREQPARFRSRLLAVLGSLIALFMVQVLLFYSQLAFLEQGPPETVAGYYVANGAVALIVIGSLVLPHARRTRLVA